MALHFRIGDSAKSDSFPTISSQIGFIRRLLTENSESANEYGKAARGELPAVFHVHNKDEIASIIALKKHHFSNARFVIMGGAESHLVAEHLAEANIPVVLNPTLCTPEDFDSIHCLTGAPLTDGLAAHVLHQHGVKIGIGVSDDGLARNLAWDAGWLSATSPRGSKAITEPDAVRFVTSNLQEIFGLVDESVTVWSGNPLKLHSQPLFTYSPQTGIVAF